MLALTLGLVATGVIIFGFGAFVSWAIKEHSLAEKYRRDARYVHPSVSFAVPQSTPDPVASTPSIPSWTVTFKDGRSTKSVVTEGATEAEAIKNLVKANSVGYGSIISSVKN